VDTSRQEVDIDLNANVENGDDDATIKAEFTSNVISGEAPLTVNFTDQSTGTVVSWDWSFGDGSTSNEQNPSHTYKNLGSYTVTLTVTGPTGSNTETKSDYIKVSHTKAMPGIPLLLLYD
jgi:PKD repeat protein